MKRQLLLYATIIAFGAIELSAAGDTEPVLKTAEAMQSNQIATTAESNTTHEANATEADASEGTYPMQGGDATTKTE